MYFDPIVVLPAKLRLCCTTDCKINGTMLAFVEGIKIGERRLSHSFASGDFLDILISYFPNVALPTKIRFLLNDNECAAPFPILSAEEVMSILGHGDIKVENLSLESGLLRGTIVNSVNSIYTPSAFIKINNQIVRSALVEPPRGRDEGGSTSRFAVPIRQSDFVETGLFVDLYVAGLDYPVANFAYMRADPTAESRRIVEIDEKVRQMQKATFLQVEMLRDSFDQRLAIQQERMDTFIEYAMSLIVDRLAGQIEAADPIAFITALQNLRVTAESAKPQAIAPPLLSSTTLALDEAAFVFGWYNVELNEAGNFRWMAQMGLIRNPFVNRAIDRVEITVSQVYGAHEPMLRATLDEQDLITHVAKQGGLFTLTFSTPSDRSITGESLYLESFASGCPAIDTGTTDDRTLSIAVTRVRIFYNSSS